VTVSRAAAAPARRAGAAAAALGVVSSVLHLLALGSMPPLLAAAMVVLALACLTCVPRLLTGPTRHTWLLVVALACGMLTLHAGAMVTAGHGAAPGEHLAAHLRGEGWDPMHLAVLAAAAELGIGLVMAHRGASVAPCGHRTTATTSWSATSGPRPPSWVSR